MSPSVRSSQTLLLSRIIGGIGVGVGGLFLILAFTSGLFPAATKFHLYAAPVLTFVLAFILVGLMLRLMETPVSERVRHRYKAYVCITFGISFILLFLVTTALKAAGYTWDAQTVFAQAIAYARHGSIDDSAVSYFVASPNNIPLLALLAGLFSAFKSINITDYLGIAVYFNAAVLALTHVLLYKCARMLYGRRIAMVTILLGAFFLTFSLYAAIPYTDTLTIVFPITLLYIGLSMVRAQTLTLKLILGVAMGVTAYIGYELKPTTLIALVALSIAGLIALARSLNRSNFKNRLGLLLGLLFAGLIGGGGAFVASTAAINAMHLVPYPLSAANENSLPVVHFANIGLRTVHAGGVTYYGGYNERLVEEAVALPDKEDRVAYSWQGIRDQLNAYGPIGYLRFLALKANWITSDGTFYAYGEGSNANVKFVNNDVISRGLRQFLAYNGTFYAYFANLLQIVWLSILLLIGAHVFVLIFQPKSRANFYMLTCRLMLIGILAFLLVFEGRSRYLYLYVPIFIVTAMYTLAWYRTAMARSGVSDDSKASARLLRAARTS